VKQAPGDVNYSIAVPHEAGWRLQAMWFSFISVDVFELDGGEPGEALGRWFIRLGTSAEAP
jgi:hypothetical protein